MANHDSTGSDQPGDVLPHDEPSPSALDAGTRRPAAPFTSFPSATSPLPTDAAAASAAVAPTSSSPRATTTPPPPPGEPPHLWAPAASGPGGLPASPAPTRTAIPLPPVRPANVAGGTNVRYGPPTAGATSLAPGVTTYGPGAFGPGGSATTTTIDDPPGRRRRRGRAALLPIGFAAIALVAGAGGGYLAGGHDTTQIVAASPAAASSAAFSGQSLSVADVVSALTGSVVSVDAQITQQRGRSTAQGEAAGTGIVYNSDGYIVTNAHVVDGATSVTVTLAGETAARDATVVSSDAEHDIAVLKVSDTTGMKPATFADSTHVAVGDEVVAVGNALALEGGMTVTQGIVSALDRQIETEESSSLTGLIQTDAPISSGNSGGPLADTAGHVIGMNTAAASSSGTVNAANIGFAIPAAQITSIVDAAIAAHS